MVWISFGICSFSFPLSFESARYGCLADPLRVPPLMRCIQVAPLPCFTAMANPQSGFHMANVSDDEMVLVFAETGDPHIAERITRRYFFSKQLFLPFCATFSFGTEKNMFHDVKRLSNFKTT